jgi:MFS superfamily sulfate permease-like transporter
LVATVLFVIIALFAMILIFVMIAVIGAFGFVVAVVSGVMMGALMVIVRTKRPHTHNYSAPKRQKIDVRIP